MTVPQVGVNLLFTCWGEVPASTTTCGQATYIDAIQDSGVRQMVCRVVLDGSKAGECDAKVKMTGPLGSE